MTEVICKCGYQGREIVIFETVRPMKELARMSYGGQYWEHVKWIKEERRTLNWACPECGAILVTQRGGLSYNRSELEDMFRRLRTNCYKNKRYLKLKAKAAAMIS